MPKLDFGMRLLMLRRSLKMGQRQIALKCGLVPSTWATWENGASPHNMNEVAEQIESHTGVPKEWLLWGSLILAAPIILGTEGEQLELPFDAAPPLLNVVGF